MLLATAFEDQDNQCPLHSFEMSIAKGFAEENIDGKI